MHTEDSAHGADAPQDTTATEPVEIQAGRVPPFSQVGDWVGLAPISDPAKVLYWILAMHLSPVRGDREVWPSREALARRMGRSRANKIDSFMRELVDLGAVEIHTRRVAGGMRARNRYTVHLTPPDGYPGPVSLADPPPGGLR